MFKSLVTSTDEIKILLESPMRIGSWDSNKLDNINDNYAICSTFKEKGINIGKYKEYDIFQYEKGNEIADIFTMDDFVSAYFNYEVRNNVMIEKRVWQDDLHIGLCRNIIFDYYLKKFNGMISDGLHSPLGEKYWKKLLKQAKDDGYEIFSINISDNNAIKLEFYGGTTSSENYRFLIKSK
jgi:hypothetical protein